jgi:hypothetical protein
MLEPDLAGDPAQVGDLQPPSNVLDEAVLLQVLSDFKNGDFDVRMPLDWTGVAGKIADTLNDVIAANRAATANAGDASRNGRAQQRTTHTGSRS